MSGTSARSQPALDLAAGAVLTAATVLVGVLGGAVPQFVRVAVGLPFLLFVPGYAVTAILYPRSAGDAPAGDPIAGNGGDRTLSGAERLLVSVAGSLVLVATVALAANFTPWGIEPGPVLSGLSGLTLLALTAAAVRRRSVPPEQCPDVAAAVTGTLGAVRSDFRATSLGGVVMNLVVLVALVGAAASVGYAVTEQPTGEQYSEYAVLTESDEGELVAGEYPSELVADGETPMHVYLENHEGERTQYTVVVELQRVADDGAVTEATEVDRVAATLDDGETQTVRHDAEPALTGEDLRLAYHFYAGDAPGDPGRETSDETLHVWIDVVDPDEA